VRCTCVGSSYYEEHETTSRPVTKNGKQCTEYGMIHHQICTHCDNEKGQRTTWGQIECPD
jgi:hypothetical protein